MSLDGKLKEFGLIDILQMISQTGKTGVLRVSSGSENSDIYFSKGKIVEIKSNIPIGLKLGNYLVSKGIITEDELFKYLEIQKKSPLRLGKLLINDNKISSDDIKKFNIEQIKEYLSIVLMFLDGHYKFESVFLDYDTQEVEPVSVDSILLDVLREIDEVKFFKKKLESFNYIFIKSSKSVIVNQNATNDEPVIDKGNFASISKDAFTIFNHIDGSNSIEDIIRKTGFSSNFVLKVIYQLQSLNCIQIYKNPKRKKSFSEIIKLKEVGLSASFIIVIIILTYLLYNFGNLITSSPFTDELRFYSELYKKDYLEYERQRDYFISGR